MPHADPIERKKYQSVYRPEWQRANRAMLRTYASRYRMAHPERMLWINARNRARKRGIQFEITEADIVIPATCPILGIPLFFKAISHKRDANPNSPSIDRIEPKRGYVKDNIQVISWRANTLKCDGTPDELRKIADFMTKQSGI